MRVQWITITLHWYLGYSSSSLRYISLTTIILQFQCRLRGMFYLHGNNTDAKLSDGGWGSPARKDTWMNANMQCNSNPYSIIAMK